MSVCIKQVVGIVVKSAQGKVGSNDFIVLHYEANKRDMACGRVCRDLEGSWRPRTLCGC